MSENNQEDLRDAVHIFAEAGVELLPDQASAAFQVFAKLCVDFFHDGFAITFPNNGGLMFDPKRNHIDIRRPPSNLEIVE